MSGQQIDETTRHRVLGALVERARADLATMAGSTDREHRASEADPDDVPTFSSTAQTSEDLALSGELEASMERQRAALAQLEEFGATPAEAVGPGSLVVLGDQHLVVGMVSEPVEIDGVSWEGLSTDAPIYAAIHGLRAGDPFTFRDTEHRIDALG